MCLKHVLVSRKAERVRGLQVIKASLVLPLQSETCRYESRRSRPGLTRSSTVGKRVDGTRSSMVCERTPCCIHDAVRLLKRALHQDVRTREMKQTKVIVLIGLVGAGVVGVMVEYDL